MSCCLPPGVNCEDKIPSKVIFERPFQNRIAGAVFIAALIVQYVLAILTLANVEDPLDCWGAGSTSAVFDFSTSFGAAMKEHIGAFILAVVLALMFGLLWIYSLQRFSLVVVWGTLILEMLIALTAAILAFCVPGGGLVGLGVTILCLDGIALMIIMIKKNAVDNAALMLQSAAYCVQYNCSMVVVALGILVIALAYSSVPIAGMAGSFIAGHWIPQNGCVPAPGTFCVCVLDQPPWINAARVFNNLVLVWAFFFFNMLRTYVVGGTAAMWYWHPETKGRPFVALKWACSSAWGTLSLGGLVVTIVDRVNRWATSKINMCCCCCNPMFLILYVIMLIYKEVVNSLAKFCIIIASITGEDFFVCVGRSYYTLKGKFTTLFVVDGVAKLVMYGACSVFSCALWAFAWFVAAGISKEPTIDYQYNMWNDPNQQVLYRILLIALWLLAGLLVYYPLVGIIVCVLWGSVVFGYFLGTSFLIGVFAGCLANYLFTFFADVILDVTTAMFTIVRIDHVNGIKIQGDLSAGSPSAVGMYYLKLSGDDEGTELAPIQPAAAPPVAAAVVTPAPATTIQVVVQQPYMAQPYMAQPYGQQPMMAQPMMAQPMMAQPMYGQGTMGQPMMAQPMYGQGTMQPMYGTGTEQYGYQPPPGYTTQSDPYDASKPSASG